MLKNLSNKITNKIKLLNLYNETNTNNFYHQKQPPLNTIPKSFMSTHSYHHINNNNTTQKLVIIQNQHFHLNQHPEENNQKTYTILKQRSQYAFLLHILKIEITKNNKNYFTQLKQTIINILSKDQSKIQNYDEKDKKLQQQKLLYFRNMICFLQFIQPQIQKIQVKNLLQSNQQQKSSLLSGQYFKTCFLIDGKHDLNSIEKTYYNDKNILNIRKYQSNYALKLRFLFKLLSRIRDSFKQQIHQMLLLNLQQTNNFSQLHQLFSWFSSKIMSPLQYSQLLSTYFQQFFPQSIKSFLLNSLGQHSPQIAQFSKQLIDVKIRQTLIKYNIKELLDVYFIERYQYLFDQNQDMYKLNKYYCEKYSRLIIDQIIKQKNRRIKENQHTKLINLQSQQNYNNHNYIKQLLPIQFLSQQFNLNFNRLFPFNYFNITDQNKIESIIKTQITQLISQNTLLNYYQNNPINININTQIIIKQIQHVIVFFNRFYLCNLSYFVNIMGFLDIWMNKNGKNVVKQIVNNNNDFIINNNNNFINNIQRQVQYNESKMFLRVMNIIYHFINNVSSFHNQQYWKARQKLQNSIKKLLSTQLQQKHLHLTQFLHKLITITRTIHPTQPSQNLIIYRLLSTFLDLHIITHKQFYQLYFFKSSTQKQNNKNYFNVILQYSDFVQKSIKQLYYFRENHIKQYEQLKQQNWNFKVFNEKVNEIQRKLNDLVREIQLQPQKIQKKYQILYKNDLMPKYLDEQHLMSYYNKQISQYNPDTLYKHKFCSKFSLLSIISQSTDFLSSTILLNYTQQIKTILSSLTVCPLKYISRFNYPFNCDLGIQRQNLYTKQKQKLYILFISNDEVKGRSRYFKDDLKGKKNFMDISANLIYYNQNKHQINQKQKYIKYIKYHQVNGIQIINQQGKIIQVKARLDHARELINFVVQWLESVQ